MPHSSESSAPSYILDTETSASSAADAFPRQVGTVLTLREQEKDQLSPAISGFSFTDPDPGVQPSIPPAVEISFGPDPFAELPHAVSRAPATMTDTLTHSESSSKRLQYYADAFGNGSSAKESATERIQRDSPIVAELRTNVIIKDEYTVVTNLSQHIAERYRRLESAILLTVTHSSCLMMGGSFEPAYILSITAVPSEVQPVTNKRNAYLIQHFIADVLHVPSNRGVIKFQDIPEEKLATNGSTVAGEIDRLEKQQQDEKNGLSQSMTNKSSRRSLIGEKRKSVLGRRDGDSIERKGSAKSIKSIKSVKGKVSTAVPSEPTPELAGNPIGNSNTKMQLPPLNLPQIHRLSPLNGINGTQCSPNIDSGSRPGTASRTVEIPRPPSARKHLSNITGPAQEIPAPPPVPIDQPNPFTTRVSKRKSLISIFKRSDVTSRSS